jgi:hypothetical protein
MPLTAKLSVGLTGSITSALDLELAESDLTKNLVIALADGLGANQATNIFSDQRTLAASANESLDLNGVLLNAFGQVINFTKVKLLAIFAAAANTNDVIVGGAASNGFISPFGGATHTNTIKPGGCLIMAAPDANGLAVVAATGDLLKIANSGAGTSITYDIVVIGN